MTIFSSERVKNVCNFFICTIMPRKISGKQSIPYRVSKKKNFFSNFANFCEIKISKFCLSFPELPKMRNDLASFYFDKYWEIKNKQYRVFQKKFFFQIVQILVDQIFFQKWRLLALKKLKMSEPFFICTIMPKKMSWRQRILYKFLIVNGHGQVTAFFWLTQTHTLEDTIDKSKKKV